MVVPYSHALTYLEITCVLVQQVMVDLMTEHLSISLESSKWKDFELKFNSGDRA